MRLREYLAGRPPNEIVRLAAKANVSPELVRLCAQGVPIKTYLRAKAVSAATGGACSIADLCEPQPKRRSKTPCP